MDGVKNAVQNGIDNLSGTSIGYNAHPDDGYRFRARTKEELMGSEHLAAANGNVRAGQRVRDPAAQQLGAPVWEEENDFGRVAMRVERNPNFNPESDHPKVQQEGWLL
jgi:hypothetical protein